MNKNRLGFLPTIIICGLIFVAYKIFKSPELDQEIEKFASKETMV